MKRYVVMGIALCIASGMGTMQSATVDLMSRITDFKNKMIKQAQQKSVKCTATVMAKNHKQYLMNFLNKEKPTLNSAEQKEVVECTM